MNMGVDFNGVSEQIQQLIASRTSIPLSLPLHISSQVRFGHGGESHELQFVHQLHHHGLVQDPLAENRQESPQTMLEREEEERDVEIDRERSVEPESTSRWPREETQALLKIRASMEAGFSDLIVKGPIWEHVSRKLAELGFNRSAKKCKEKFENVSKYYKKTKHGRNNKQHGKNYKFFSELEALYSGVNSKTLAASHGKIEEMGLNIEGTSGDDETQESPCKANETLENTSIKKRKNKENYLELVKGLCEAVVEQIIAQQEELQKKFLEVVEKKEEERVAREEAWKREEMERMNREMDIRAQKHTLASNREATIIGFLNKFTNVSQRQEKNNKKNNTMTIPNSSTIGSSNPNSICEAKKSWPKSEVYTLISLRCKLEESFKEASSKVSPWEQISQGMLELGYNRSAKRCKEKWENINKYFRKTKDSMKIRSQRSKTCSYFHQLSNLYQNGVLFLPTHKPINASSSLKDALDLPEDCFGIDGSPPPESSSQHGFYDAMVHVDEQA